jgi:hypothetical protein
MPGNGAMLSLKLNQQKIIGFKINEVFTENLFTERESPGALLRHYSWPISSITKFNFKE